MTSPSPPGATKLDAIPAPGMNQGDPIVIDRGSDREETNLIAAFGSIILGSPTRYVHPTGTMIEVIPRIGNTTPMSPHNSPPPSIMTLPITAPASPSMPYPTAPPPHPLAHPVPMVEGRRLGPLPHPDPGMLPLPANVDFAQEAAVK